ncbi:MAG: carboxylesterase [Tenericutes bacterium HGW-Tenericutes-2]|jgi:phospholipase/carboxylesterase|nr:MAG: carboxylesterase [Tenericutes bacterium HGW-Tenericutes-2]
MKHLYQPGTSGITLLLLHGTGGNEFDLLDLAKHIDPTANVLSVRGNVLEYGMLRFFKRLAMGVFDMDSLIEETENLYKFIDDSANQYNFDRSKVIALGYSNGANIAASILLHYDKPFYAAMLFHPMVPIRNLEKTNLKNISIFIGAGKNDQMVPDGEIEELNAMFDRSEAKTIVFWTDHGHQLNKEEIDQAKIWYEKL